MRYLLTLLGVMFSLQILAAPPEFDNKAQEGRYQALISELRCPKCLNTNLAGSDAPIAEDLRQEVSRQIRAGRSDAQIRSHLQERYGDFILYDPPLRWDTAVLWFSPLLLLLLGVFVILRARGVARAGESSIPSSPEEPAEAQGTPSEAQQDR